jgi:hypothetical protein
MRILTVATLFLSCAIAIDAQGNRSPTPSIAGRWMLTTSADGPHGAASMPLVLTQDGRKITATLTPPHGGDLPLAGEFANGELKLATTGDKEQHPPVTLQAKFKEDGSMAGFVSGPMGDVMFTGVRAKKLP